MYEFSDLVSKEINMIRSYADKQGLDLHFRDLGDFISDNYMSSSIVIAVEWKRWGPIRGACVIRKNGLGRELMSCELEKDQRLDWIKKKILGAS